MKKRIYIHAYFPFTLGGDVWRPISTEVDVGKKMPIGKGFFAHSTKAPNNKTFIVEHESGGIIGSSFVQVRKDIREGTKEMMRVQVAHACREMQRARHYPPDIFWQRVKGATK